MRRDHAYALPPRNPRLGEPVSRFVGPQTLLVTLSLIDISIGILRRCRCGLSSSLATTGPGPQDQAERRNKTQKIGLHVARDHQTLLAQVRRLKRQLVADAGIRVLGRLSYVVDLGIPFPAVYLGPWMMQTSWATEGPWVCKQQRMSRPHADQVGNYRRTSGRNLPQTPMATRCGRHRDRSRWLQARLTRSV